MRNVVKAWVPQSLRTAIRTWTGSNNRFVGPFPNWEAAARASGGYDSAVILDRTFSAALTVQRGEAAYERDSLLFNQPDPPFALISALMLAVAQTQQPLRVLDFGGSLASLYFRCIPFLDTLHQPRWCVVEQPHVVACGREHFERAGLLFRGSVPSAVEALGGTPSIVVMSSVIAYVESPYELVETLCGIGAMVLFIDRTVFAEDGVERIFVQRVPKRLYPASYPLRFLSWPQIAGSLERNHARIVDFDSWEGVIRSGAFRARYRGGIWLKTDRAVIP